MPLGRKFVLARPEPRVVNLVIHYLAPSEDGPIGTQRRVATQGGREAVICPGGRYRVACQPERPYLARASGKGPLLRLEESFHATGQMFRTVVVGGAEVLHELVSCPRCKTSALYKRDEAAQRATFGPGPAKGV